MARSYRKPYSYWTGVYANVKADRILAARGVRRRQNQEVRAELKNQQAVVRSEMAVWELGEHNVFCSELLLSHRYECAHNDRNGWNCDGRAYLATNPDDDKQNYHVLQLATETDPYWIAYHTEMMEKDRYRYLKLTRK